MKVSIIGSGYVGLVSGAGLAAVDHQVTCVDLLEDRVRKINCGEAPFYEPGLADLLRRTVGNGSLRATTCLAEAVADSEVTLIAVGTPDRDGVIDLSFIKAAALEIGAALKGKSGYHVVAVKSTVVPGTTDTLVRGALEAASGKGVGEFGLCMNPEFLREGNAITDFMEPDRIIIGQWDDPSGQTFAALYQPFDCPKVFTSLRNAEMIKYASNALLATLISFSNELSNLCESTPGTDVELVMDGLHLDHRLSPKVNGQRITPEILSYLRAGCGFGGSCLPKDVKALRAYARGHGINPYLLDAVMAINIQRPLRLIELAEKILGTLHDRTIALLGLAFKPGTDDLRESPALTIIHHLLHRGVKVRGYDPAIGAASSALDLPISLCLDPQELLSGVDAALLVTSWPEFMQWNWTDLCSLMRHPLIIDGRNALRGLTWPATANYVPIGRIPDVKRDNK